MNNTSNINGKFLKKPARILLISAGTFFIGVGIIGIFIPILPTTPFILVAAALYARSSQKFYNWLINNKVFGRYVKNYREGKGIPIKIKVLTVVFLYITIGLSAVFATNILWIRIILAVIAIGVTIHIVKVKTFRY